MKKRYINIIVENLKYWIIFNTFFSLFMGIQPIINIYLTKNIVNTIQKFTNGETINQSLVYLLLAAVFTLTIVQMLLTNYTMYIDNKYEAKLNFVLEKLVIEKSVEVPYFYFENTHFQDHLNRITINIGNKFITPIKGMLGIFQKIISFISVFIYIFSYSKISALILLMLIPILLFNIKIGKSKFQMSIYQTPKAREMSYLNNLLLKRENAMEIRLFNLGKYFTNRWSKLYWSVNTQIISLNKKATIQNSLLSLITTLLFSLIIIQSVFLIFLKKNTLGGFVAVLQSLNTVQESLFSLSSDIVWVFTDFLYITDFFNLINFKDSNYLIEDNKEIVDMYLESKNPIIEFSNVSFNYPYSNQEVLKNISFSINKGEKIAIVGENGSGKSTILKCLMKLAYPENGEIFVNGKDIKHISIDSLLNFMSVIPQNYTKYNLSLKDNIVLNQEFKINKFTTIVESTGINKLANNLKNGYETYLGKEFIEGEDLSGGQWQSIAISRARYKDSQILVMDEPTSALDYHAEEKLYKELIESVNNKTVIYISHRTSFTRLADKILVLKNGSIVELGNHDNLMENRGDYYEMFTTQANRYK